MRQSDHENDGDYDFLTSYKSRAFATEDWGPENAGEAKEAAVDKMSGSIGHF